MVSGKVVVKNQEGLHLRPAGTLCNEAIRFSSKISFRIRNYTGNAKSVLSVLAGGVKCGDEIEIICEGEDEQMALDSLIALVENELTLVKA